MFQLGAAHSVNHPISIICTVGDAGVQFIYIMVCCTVWLKLSLMLFNAAFTDEMIFKALSGINQSVAGAACSKFGRVLIHAIRLLSNYSCTGRLILTGSYLVA